MFKDTNIFWWWWRFWRKTVAQISSIRKASTCKAPSNPVRFPFLILVSFLWNPCRRFYLWCIPFCSPFCLFNSKIVTCCTVPRSSFIFTFSPRTCQRICCLISSVCCGQLRVFVHIFPVVVDITPQFCNFSFTSDTIYCFEKSFKLSSRWILQHIGFTSI